MTKKKAELPPLPDKIDLNKVVPSKGPRSLKKGLKCMVDTCGRDNYAFGLCSYHSNKLKKTRPEEFKLVKETSRAIIIMCSVEFCINDSKEHGMCSKHYAAWQKENIPGYREKVRENNRKRNQLTEVKEKSRASAKQRRKDKHVYFEDGTQETPKGDFIEIKTNLHTLAERTGYIKNLLLGYLDNLVEEGVINSYTYDNKSLVITMLVPKALHFYFQTNEDLNQKPPGVLSLEYGDDHWLRHGKDSAEKRKTPRKDEFYEELDDSEDDFTSN
jgi:hypothetical protein